jgi:hypothetical protein
MDNGGLTTQFQAITGASPDEAAAFIAMSGGNLETALSIFFDQGGSGMAMDVAAPTAFQWNRGAEEIPAWYSGLIWPEMSAINPAWVEQELRFVHGLGLPQNKNGPCGVLAAIQAVIIAQNWDTAPGFGPDFVVEPAHIAKALMSIIANCSGDGECTVCTWKQMDKVKTCSG